MTLRRSCIASLLIVLLLLVQTSVASIGTAGPLPITGASSDEFPIASDAAVIPLREDPPSWMTPDLEARIIDAGLKGKAFDLDTQQEVEVGTSLLSLQPGAWMITPSHCTMNFIYAAPGKYYMGTAGHCTQVGQSVILRIVLSAGGLAAIYIGDTVASSNNGIGDDWALVEIRSVWHPMIDPSVDTVGGPKGGAYTGAGIGLEPGPVKHFGHGLGVGTGGTPRVGNSLYVDTTAFYFHGVASPGDSGSPVVLVATDPNGGEGLGILTHLIVVGPGASIVAGTRLTVVPATLVDAP